MNSTLRLLDLLWGDGKWRLGGFAWFVLLAVVWPPLAASGSAQVSASAVQSPVESSNRLGVLILTFANRTGDRSLNYLRNAPETLLSQALRETSAIRLVPGRSYGLRQIHKRERDQLDSAQALKAGRILGAGRVVWGAYRRNGTNWAIQLRMLNIDTGKLTSPLMAIGTDWFAIRDELVSKLLGQLEVDPTPAEKARIFKHWTTSPKALSLFCNALELGDDRKPLKDIEFLLRKALEADPGCAQAHAALAEVLYCESRNGDAEGEATIAVKLDSGLVTAQVIMGTVLEVKGKYEEAKKAFETALRLAPTDEDALERLGWLYARQGMSARAQELYEQASLAAPFSASAHALLAYRYALAGNTAQARQEIERANRLASPAEVYLQMELGDTCMCLRDLRSAELHYRKYIQAAGKLGMFPDTVQALKQEVAAFQTRLTPTYLKTSEPKHYSKTSLEAFLRQTLSPAELGLVTNPLECTPEMEKWAHRLTASARNDLQKAQLLMNALAAHPSSGYGGTRTAAEVFAAWHDPSGSFLCGEYSALYVALSRACGLNTYCTLVDEDFSGTTVLHECACLFLHGKALLVDPSYVWFGVPHRKFKVLNDVEALAVWLSQADSQTPIARRLAPELAEVRFSYILWLMQSGRVDQASQELTAALKVEPDSQMALCVRGALTLYQNNIPESILLLERATAMHPMLSLPYSFLGYAYWNAGDLQAARDAFQDALHRAYNTSEQAHLTNAIAEIDEQLGPVPETLAAPKNAADFVRRARSYVARGDFSSAIVDYTQAIQLEPGNIEAYKGRAGEYLRQDAPAECIFDCGQLLRLAPDDVPTLVVRGTAYSENQQFARALDDFRQVLVLEPTNTFALIALARLLANCPDLSLRDGEQAVQVSTMACELTNWKNSEAAQVLVTAAEEVKREKAVAASALSQRHLVNADPSQKDTSVLSQPPAPNQTDDTGLRKAAEAGDPEAAAKLADMFNRAPSSSTNTLQAYKWAALAARQGNKESQVLVHELELFMTPAELSQGKNAVQQFLATHRELKAQTHQHQPAKVVNAKPDRKDISVLSQSPAAEQSDDAALRQAAEAGDPEAAAKLADMFNRAPGSSTNTLQAYKWATLAARQGNKESQILVHELELFMTSEELSQGKNALQQFLAAHGELKAQTRSQQTAK